MKDKTNVFDFNHIDPSINEEKLEELKQLYRAYHKKFWCYRRVYKHHKMMNLASNATTTFFVALGAAAGGATMNPILLGVFVGVGLTMKTIHEIKNFNMKINNSKMAFTTYKNALEELKVALRIGRFNKDEFVFSMEKVDQIVNDYGLDLAKHEKAYDRLFE